MKWLRCFAFRTFMCFLIVAPGGKLAFGQAHPQAPGGEFYPTLAEVMSAYRNAVQESPSWVFHSTEWNDARDSMLSVNLGNHKMEVFWMRNSGSSAPDIVESMQDPNYQVVVNGEVVFDVRGWLRDNALDSGVFTFE